MSSGSRSNLMGFLRTLETLDQEREALFDSIRPALDAMRCNRVAVYRAMVDELPVPVVIELDRLYQRFLWGVDASEWVEGNPPRCVQESIERGEGLFATRYGALWGLGERGHEMMSDELARGRVREILAAHGQMNQA